MCSAFRSLCPRYIGSLNLTAPTAIRLCKNFTFTYPLDAIGAVYHQFYFISILYIVQVLSRSSIRLPVHHALPELKHLCHR